MITYQRISVNGNIVPIREQKRVAASIDAAAHPFNLLLQVQEFYQEAEFPFVLQWT